VRGWLTSAGGMLLPKIGWGLVFSFTR